MNFIMIFLSGGFDFCVLTCLTAQEPRRQAVTPGVPKARGFLRVACNAIVRRPQWEADAHRTLQTKFAASFVLPTPVYCATCG